MSSTPQEPSAPTDEPPRRAVPSRRDESALRLQDIARQLSDLAQKERQTGAARPLEPERRGSAEDEQALARILERIDDNERQTVEAFTAVNERLSVLGRQIAAQPRAEPFARPEDVPGYTTLESAIRNVVEHIEVSEKRTRDSLKAMQDRLGELAEQAQRPNAAEPQRTAPVITALEARITELSNRLLRTESTLQAGMPDHVRREFQQITERIDTVKASAASLARSELREIETRVLATLKEAQAAAGAPGAAPDLSQIRGEIGGLSRRMDEIKANSATERDLHALRLALEHLSSRVAQGPDLRPLAEMERRLADLGQRVEEAARSQTDPGALERLEQSIAAADGRIARAEEQLGHIETMEQAIRQLYASLEQNRGIAGQAAEDAANRAVERMLASGMPQARSPELKALEDGLRAVRDSAAGAERRNQETLAAVHETLSQIVDKIAELEAGTPSRGHPSAAHAFASGPAPAPEMAPPEPEPEPEPEAMREPPPAQSQHPEPLAPTDDFIAAARRAAQAAASRPSALRAEFGPVMPPEEEEEDRLALLRRFHQRPSAATKPNPGAKDKASRRRVLLLAGAVLLAAVSAFAFNMLVKTAPPPAPAPVIESPALQPPPAAERDKQSLLMDLPADRVVTGSLPAPATAAPASLPPAGTGPEALRTAAGAGDAAAQFIVASRYLDGEGVTADPARAAFWYEQAAAAGLAPAQYRLGTLFERGMGVSRDLRLALSWYERAAAQGNVKSMHNAAVISLGGEAGPADPARAFSLFSASAERGLRDSQFNLAILHERGMGTKPDKAEALFWYRLAASQGDAAAAARANTLAAALSPEAMSRIEARVAKWAPQPSVDSANVVAILDPAWKDPRTTVLLSGAAEPLVSVSDTGLVAEAQHLLLLLGFNVGTPDGRLGSRTVAALREFQAEAGLEVTGEVTPELLEAMRARAG